MASLPLALAVLMAGMLCVLWAMWAPQRERRQLARRIALIEVRPQSPTGRRDAAHRLDGALRRWLTFGTGRHWGMRASPALLIGLVLGAGGAALALGQAIALPLWVSVPIAVAAAIALPRTVLRRQQVGAETAFMNHFPDAIDMVIRMLRAGLPMTAIMRVLGREAPTPIDRVFTRLADQLEIGLPFTEALGAMSERIGLPDFRFFTMAVALQSDTGGNLASTLETLSSIIRKRREIRLQARSSTAEVRVSAWLLGGLPVLVTLLLVVSSPHYLLPLLQDRRGNLIILVAAAMLAFGVLSMRQMMRRVTRL